MRRSVLYLFLLCFVLLYRGGSEDLFPYGRRERGIRLFRAGAAARGRGLGRDLFRPGRCRSDSVGKDEPEKGYNDLGFRIVVETK